MTQTLSRSGWIQASVGCHWTQGRYIISAESGGGQPNGYVLRHRFMQLGERYPTFDAAVIAAERDAMREAPKKSATETYAERFATCQTLIAQLQEALNEHCSRQDIDQENSGYVGDLARYAQTLRDLLETMPKAETEVLS